MSMTRIVLTGAVLACLTTPGPVRADSFFLTVFGAQPPGLKDPRYTHSWGSFARIGADGRVAAFAISWLPVTGIVRPFALQPEAGRNYTLEETLEFCRRNDMVVSCWGPYRIHPDLWNRAVAQKARLESGQVLYKAIDGGAQDGTVTNCIHALGYLAREPGQRVPHVIVAPANWGESGSYWLALTFRPWYIDPCRRYPWVLQRLGVNPDAFKVNDLCRNPTRNPITQTVQGMIHTYLLPNRVCCTP